MHKFSDICGGRYFLIPENQRGFSWTKDQVYDIIADLTLAGTQSHYMGPLIVSRTEKSDFQDDDLTTTAEFILEDGQQRLTTLFLFANELRKSMETRSVHLVHSEQLSNFVFLKHKGVFPRLRNRLQILDNYFSFILTGLPSEPAERIPSMGSLDEVKDCIAEFVVSLGDIDLLTWKQRICNQALFVWVDLATAGVNRYLTFDAINSRGLPLSEFDKIKNFCMLVCSARGMKTIDIAAHWYKALVQLESFGVNSRANEADFIAELYSSYHNKSVSHREVHSAFVAKYRGLLTDSDALLEADLSHFVGLWETYASSFGFLTCRNRQKDYGTLCSVDAGNWLNRLDNMNLSTITRPILAASHLKFTKDEFCEVAKACEIYTFRVHAVIRRRKDANSPKIIELANSIIMGGIDIKDVLRRICQWLNVLAPLKNVVNELADGKPKYAHDPMVAGWSHCYYFLYEYELSVSPVGVSPIAYVSNKELAKNQQEHILPQQHRDNGWWQDHWPDTYQAEKYKHRLGNLVLTVDNLALGRKSISEKIKEHPPAHCYTHPNATNSEKRIPLFTDGNMWQSSNILKREYEMVKFAVARWGLGCSNDNGEVLLSDEFHDVGHTSIVVESVVTLDEEESSILAGDDADDDDNMI